MSTPREIRKVRKQRRAEWDDPADAYRATDREYAMPMTGEVFQERVESTAALGLSPSRIEGKGMDTSRRSSQ